MVARVRPRDVNAIASVEHLLLSWSGTDAQRSKQFRTSAAGNINYAGELHGKYAETFFPREELFEASIEPGVRPIVLALVRTGGFVTYTSCEGHRYDDGSTSECHVGVLPRSREELRRLLRALRFSAAQCLTRMRASRAHLYPWYLHDEACRREVPVLDLYLHRRIGFTQDHYFRARSADASLFASVLRGFLEAGKDGN
jgi:uncharacterized protein